MRSRECATQQIYKRLGLAVSLAVTLTFILLLFPLTTSHLPPQLSPLQADTVQAAGGLTVTQSLNRAFVLQGSITSAGRLDYNMQIQNSTGSDYSGPLTISLTLPPGANCTNVSNLTVGWQIDEAMCQQTNVANLFLSAGRVFTDGTTTSARVTITPTAADQTSLDFDNVTISGLPASAPAPMLMPTTVSAVVNAPEWTIQKTVIPTPSIDLGEVITYSIFVTNSGSYNLLNSRYTVTEQLPSGINYDIVGWTAMPAALGQLITTPTQFSWLFESGASIAPGNTTPLSPLTVALRVNSTASLTDLNIVNETYTVSGGSNVISDGLGSPITISVTPRITLSLIKSGPSTVLAGELLTYTLSLTNDATSNGSTPLGLGVYDTVATYTDIITFGFLGGVNGQLVDFRPTNVGWLFDEVINPGQTVQMFIVARVLTPVVGGTVFTNVDYEFLPALPTGYTQTPNPAPPVTTTIEVKPELEIRKFASADPILGGNTLTYTIRYTNIGSGIASSIRLTDSFSSSFGNSITTTSPADLAPYGTAATWELSVSVPLTTISGTILTNQIEITSDEGLLKSDVITTRVFGVPNLAVSKTASPSPAMAGETVTYQIRYTNSSTATAEATGVILSDSFNDGINPLQSNNFNVGTLAVGDTGTQMLQFTVPTDTLTGTLLSNMVSLSSDQGVTDSFTLNTLALGKPFLHLHKTASDAVTGETLTYTIYYSNSGGAAATNLTIKDVFESEFSGTLVTNYSLANLAASAPGATTAATPIVLTFEVPLTATGNTLLTNTVTISSAEGVTATHVVTRRVRKEGPDLSISKTSAISLAMPGERITYTYYFTNNSSTKTAVDVVIFDVLPPSLAFDETAVPTKWSMAGSNVYSSYIGEMPPSAVGTIDFVVTVLSDAMSPLTNTGSITYSPATGFDPNMADNVTTNNQVVVPMPRVALQTDNQTATGAPGQVVGYAINVINQGNTFDRFTVTVTPGAYAASANQQSVALQPGEQTTVLITVTIPAEANLGDSDSTTVLVESGLQSSVRQSMRLTTLVATAQLHISKDDGGAVATPNGQIIYTLHYTNQGNTPAEGVVINEFVPVNTIFDAANSSSGWDCENGASGGTPCALNLTTTLSLSETGQVQFAVYVVSPVSDDALPIANLATIADDRGNLSTALITTPLNLPPGPTEIYLPILAKMGPPAARDLVVSGVTVSELNPTTGEAVTLEVTLRNDGTEVIITPFWVDLYLATTPLEPTINQSWDEAFADSLVPYGVAWRVYDMPARGERLLTNLVPNDPQDLTKNYSNFIPPNLGQWEQTWKGEALHNYFREPGRYYLYVQVDSFGEGSHGAVLEGNEDNNLFGPIEINVSGAVLAFEPQQFEELGILSNRSERPAVRP